LLTNNSGINSNSEELKKGCSDPTLFIDKPIQKIH